jgi:hypothetical protein
MKKKYYLVILFLILTIFLVGCGGVIIPSINLTGDWTMTNTTTYTTYPFFDIGEVTTAKCNIVDNNRSLTIDIFWIVGQEYIDWNVGYGTFSNSTLTFNISGSFIYPTGNIYESTESYAIYYVIYFEGNIDANGISGSGTWIQTLNDLGYIYSASGTTIFIKG